MSDDARVLEEQFIYDHLDVALQLVRTFKRFDGDEVFSVALGELDTLSKRDLSDRFDLKGYVRARIFIAIKHYIGRERKRRRLMLNVLDTIEEEKTHERQRDIRPTDAEAYLDQEIVRITPLEKVTRQLRPGRFDADTERIIRAYHVHGASIYSIAKLDGGIHRKKHVRLVLKKFQLYMSQLEDISDHENDCYC